MEYIFLGIIMMAIGTLSVLDAFGWVEVLSWWPLLSGALTMMLGVYAILRANSRMTAQRVQKRADREQKQKTASLEQELEKKQQEVEKQSEALDDLVNPKMPPQV